MAGWTARTGCFAVLGVIFALARAGSAERVSDCAEAAHAYHPKALLTNGKQDALVFLPDAKNGYYRSTRFDWSGAVYNLKYKGHDFYGTWYDRIDPKVINWVYQGTEIVSGPCSALAGPVDEFAVPLGFEEAKAGGTFIKLGVGVLRKVDDAAYNRYLPYEVL